MFSFSWKNVLKNLFGVRGSNGGKRTKRTSVFSRVENLEERALLSAITLDVSPRELRAQERAEAQGRKRAPNNNPSGATITITYPDLDVDINAGETVHLATITVRSNGKKDLYYSGSTAEGDNLDEIFANLRIENIKQVAVNDDVVNITGFNAIIKRKDTVEEYKVYGQAKANLPAGTTIGSFRMKDGQVRYLKPKWPGFVHYSEGGQHIPQIKAHGAPIVNPDPAGFTVFPGDQTVEEGTNSSVGVVLDAQPVSNVTLNFNLSAGPIGLSSSAVTFTPQNWNIPQYVSLSAPENSVDQPDQTQTLTVSVNDALSDNAFDPLTEKVFMYGFSDNDPTVNPIAGDFTFSLNPTSINENGGVTTGTITLNSTFTSNVSIQVSTLSSALTGGGTLTFAPGETVKTITFASVNNTTDEADRVVTITATVLAGSDSRFTAGLSKSATLTIVDDDPTVNPVQGDFTLNVSPTSINEAGGVTTATVTLNSTFSSNVSVQVSAANGLSGGTTLVFAPGETVKTVTLNAINNTTDEADRVVTITATVLAGSDSRFTAGLSKSATLTIVDDDPTVDPNPQGPEISRFITYLGTTSGILKVKSFTFATNLTSLTHTKAAYDFDGNGDVGSELSEYLPTTVSAVVNGQVTISFDLEIGPGSYGFQIRSRHPGIQNATLTPVSALVETLDGQVKTVTFTPNAAGGPWFYETTIAA